MRDRILVGFSLLFGLAGLVILNFACGFAVMNMPPPEQLDLYRRAFYARAAVGIGCILVGVILLKLRKRGAQGTDPSSK